MYNSSAIGTSLGQAPPAWGRRCCQSRTNSHSAFLGSSLHGASRSDDAGDSWQLANGGIEGFATERLAVDSIAPEKAYVLSAIDNASRIARTTDGGASWLDAPHAQTGDFVADLVVASTLPSTLYAADDAQEANPRPLVKSVDGGVSWTRHAVAGLTGFFPRVVADPTDADVVCLFTHYQVAKSTDGGGAWSVASVFFPPNAAHVTAGAVDPSNPLRVLAAAADNFPQPTIDQSGVYLSTNGGVAWTRIHPRRAQAVAFHPFDGRIFAASESGVIASADDGASWTDLTGNLPLQQPADLVATSSALYVTPRRAGLFRLDFVPCEATPATTCRHGIGPRAGQLRWQARTPATAVLRATLARLEATTRVQLGDPFGATSYGACVYDHGGLGGTARLITAMTAPAASGCGDPPCWTDTRGVLRYHDSAHTPDGLALLKAKPGGAGDTRFVVRGRGAALALPAAPVVPPVLLQIRRNDASLCWESAFSVGITRNDARAFRARSD